MIYTVTLNPSIDYVLRLNSFKAGAVNRAFDGEYYVGGKGINVSRVLSQLGLESTALGFVGGFTGDEIENRIRDNRITPEFIRLSTEISRINVKIRGVNETEINSQGPRVSGAELEQLMKKIDEISDGDTLILSGSAPRLTENDVYTRILERIRGKRVRVAVDAEKDLLLPTLKFRPFLIKPNRSELSGIFSVGINTAEDVEKYAKKLQEMGAKNVLVSLGDEGAVLMDEFGNKHTADALKGEAVSTVGAGDSMVAGFIAGYEIERSYSYALKLGSACGSATAFSSGLAEKEKINELLKTIN